MKLLPVLAVPAALILVAACGGGGSPGAAQSTAPAPTPSATTGARSVSQTTARPPAMAGVTAGGSLVLLSSATGAPIRALVRGSVIGDEISVSGDGQTIYFSRRHGCVDDVESVPLSGGKPTLITTGSLPAISPDGSTLAFARQPTLTRHCMAAGSGDLSAQYDLVTRTLSTGVERIYPVLPPASRAGCPRPSRTCPGPIMAPSWPSPSPRSRTTRAGRSHCWTPRQPRITWAEPGSRRCR